MYVQHILKTKIRIATVIFFAYLQNVFELLDQGVKYMLLICIVFRHQAVL